MANRDNLEYNKFMLDTDTWLVNLKAVEGDSPATALLSWNIEELESKKFTTNWSVRIITSF